jgi:hypothetical protein
MPIESRAACKVMRALLRTIRLTSGDEVSDTGGYALPSARRVASRKDLP